MGLPFHTLDVFTDTPLGGNPLAVVLDAEGLDKARMQAIAREFNLSETVFVLPAEAPAHTARLRIFTPKGELPFAGHPTVGTAVLLAELNGADAGARRDAIIVLEEEVGPVRVGVRMRPGEAPFAAFDVPKLPRDGGAPAPEDQIAAALGLAPSEIGFENHVPSRFTAGIAFTFVPVRDLETIGRARIVAQHWAAGFRGDSLGAAYLYCRQTVHTHSHFHARMFAPGLGLPEDPATGAAAAAFAGVLHRFDAPTSGAHSCLIEQGYEMSRPSSITLEVEIAGGEMRNVRIGGHAVHVMKGELAV